MSQYDPMFDHKVFALKNILVLFAKHDSGELRCPATALIIIMLAKRTRMRSHPRTE